MIAEARVCDFCLARDRTSLAHATCTLCKLDYCDDDGAERKIDMRTPSGVVQTSVTIATCNSCGGVNNAGVDARLVRSIYDLLPGLRDQIVSAWQAILAAQALTKE